jgi:predicted ATPase/transcriptional regulator with XRE-family HTH domain
MTEDQRTFGSLLRRYRVEAGLTQEGLAERAGLSLRGVSDLERGLRRLPYPDTVERLIEALGLGPAERDALFAARRPVPSGEQADPAARLPKSPLPVPLTSFVGRETELNEVRRLLGTSRLVTLTGVGGVGKTRLALEAARQQAAAFEHGVQFVPLAGVGATILLASAIADALGVTLRGPAEPNLRLIQYLRNKHLLLVLDNFEHLLDGARLLIEILDTASNLSILVTSRERLNLQEEWVFRVNGLGFPDRYDTEPVGEFPAVQLFVQRARQVRADFSLSENTQPIIEVCRRVEGLPLALELAATWLRVMPCDEISLEIERSLDFLTTTARNVAERHRSLRAVFDRSWSLLSEAEQSVLAQLSVFRGGFDRDAAGQVANASLAMLADLTDKSLIRPAPAGRFDLHELVRQYLTLKLAEKGATEAARQRHFQFFAALADVAEGHLYGPDQEDWYDRLELDYDNFAAAFRWSISDVEHAEAGLCLAGALSFFFEHRAHFHSGFAWVEKLVALPSAAPVSVRAKALWTAGVLAHYVGDDNKAVARLEESLALAQTVGDKRITAWCLACMGFYELDVERAITLLEEALRLFRALGDGWGISHALRRLGWELIGKGDLERAETLLQEALLLARNARNKHATAWSLFILGAAVWLRTRRPEPARTLWQESLLLAEETRDRYNREFVLLMRGQVAKAEGDYKQAEALYGEIVDLEEEHGALDYQAGIGHQLLVARAQLAADTGKPETAVRLFGAARMVPGVQLLGAGFRNGGDVETELAALRVQLGESAFATAFAEGRAMPIEQAVGHGLRGFEPTSGQPAIGSAAFSSR